MRVLILPFSYEILEASEPLLISYTRGLIYFIFHICTCNIWFLKREIMYQQIQMKIYIEVD